MTYTITYGYSSVSIRRELSDEYQHDSVYMVSQFSVHFSDMDESSLSMESYI